MSATYKDLASIKYVIDHDCGLYVIGETSGSFDEHKLKEYLKQFGNEGKNDLLYSLARMTSQVIQNWQQIQQENYPHACKGS